VKVILDGMKEGYLSWSERTKFVRDHNYLVRRFSPLRFDESMCLIVFFLKRYHLLSLELGCKSYKLRGDVARGCFLFEERTLTSYKSRTISSSGLKFEVCVDYCVIFLQMYHKITLELVCESYRLRSKVVMNYL